MAKENQDGQEKTEQASSRKLEQARNKGNVAKSQDINSIAVLVSGFLAIYFFGGWMLHRLMSMATGIYLRIDEITIDPFSFPHYARGASVWLLTTLSPVLIMVFIAAVMVNYLQFGFIWSSYNLKPKLHNFKLLSNLKRMFDQKAFVKLGINILKLIAIAWTAYSVVIKAWPSFIPMMDASVGQIFLFICNTIVKVYFWVLGLLIILSLIDFVYQKYKWNEDMKMTKQEKKDEFKMSEGDPKVKAKMREMQMKFAFNSMIKELPKADVVVTNPIHVAVALKYQPESMQAPMVIGKGKRKLAERIKEIAREHDVPIIENPPLARALFKTCEVGDEIPGQFYQDVAEILARIYELKGKVNVA